MMIGILMATLLWTACLSNESAAAVPTLTGEPPLVIAHRGASGERPEHTLAAYELAIEQGTDVIEPDLVMTSDGVLVVRHDRYLSTTTDVAAHPEFADRQRRQLSGGQIKNDWWTEDFTLSELRTLRAIQPRKDRSPDFDGLYQIPTFDEVIVLAKREGVSIYPETKAPSAHARAGLDMETALLAALTKAGWTTADAPVFVQSFEPEILRSLNEKIEVPLVQLVTAIPSPAGPKPNIPLADIATYADGVGPEKTLIFDRKGRKTGFVGEAHKLGLYVHPWTYRDDQPPADGADIETELKRSFAAGVDGVFTDFPATAVRVRDE